MSGIIIATVLLAITGLIIGVALVFTGRKFAVEVDERETAVRECLPGNNCGACGFAGCDAMAAAIVKGDAPVNGCPVGGAPVAAEVGKIMGVSAEAQEKKVAFVRCAGTCNVSKQKGNYVGIRDCRSAALAGVKVYECDHGCYGFGNCAAVCPQGAIHVVDGLARVDREACIGCQLCTKECPQNLIEMMPYAKHVAVQCHSTEKGPQVRKSCSAGCIGCGLCEKNCPFDAIHVNNNLAHIDYDKCKQCKICVGKCPAKVIRVLPDGKVSVKAEAAEA